MKINQIVISEMATTAGSVATVAKPMGETQRRPEVAGLKPVGQLKNSKKKGPYANSLISEGRVKELSMDLSGKDALSDADFKKKYGKTKQQVRSEMKAKPPQQKIKEERLEEDDIIVVPGHGTKRKNGFVPKGQSRVDHEVEMARSDVLATMKNAKSIYELLQNRTEEEGIEGWVQEKLIKANDYLNAVKEYYDEKMMQEMSGGVIAAGGVGEGVAEGSDDQVKKVFKKNGKPVGEVGIDPEASPGNGQWYMKCYAYNIDNSGYDSYKEAVEELKYCLKQGVAEGFANKLSREEYDSIITAVSKFKDEYGYEPSGPDVDELAYSLGVEPDMVVAVMYGRIYPNDGSAQGVAEGLEDSSVQQAIIDTVERLFRKNKIGDYGSLEAVRQGVRHHFSKPGATVESAIDGILNILNKRMRKSGNYVDLGRFREALRQGIAHQVKKQGVAEAAKWRRDDLEGKTWRSADWDDGDLSPGKIQIDRHGKDVDDYGDELNARPGMWGGKYKRMTKKGTPTQHELGMQNNTKMRMKMQKKQGGLTGPKGSLPEGDKSKEKKTGINLSTLRAAAKTAKPVNPNDLVVPLSDVPIKKPRGHKQYDPSHDFPDLNIFKKSVKEGEKVDRMVKHIAQSEREAGKSKKEAENIAWATVNKRGYLDNKNKKKGK